RRSSSTLFPYTTLFRSTRRQIFAYSLLVAASGVLPAAFGYSSWAYGLAAALLGAGFVRYAWDVLVAGATDLKPAKALFGYSLLYLFAIFALVLVDHIAMRMLG